MKRVNAAALLLFSWCLLATDAARAQPIYSTPQDADRTHRHFGFFIRMDLGLGYMNAKASNNSISGGAGALGIALGGAVTENLIVGVHLWDNAAPSPTFSNGTQSASPNDTTLGLVGIGPEINYYLMPYNVYFALTAGISKLTLTVANTSGSTNTGFGGRLAIGKEWWVSDHWGLGAAAHFSLGINSDSGSSSTTWSTPAFAIAFSATYN